ncbi:MAG: hypothetical protein IT379_30355 [Deltaproteobacteria bacterium]|nr:hypothetical protein [Deltaproteobacteria bacterium]
MTDNRLTPNRVLGALQQELGNQLFGYLMLLGKSEPPFGVRTILEATGTRDRDRNAVDAAWRRLVTSWNAPRSREAADRPILPNHVMLRRRLVGDSLRHNVVRLSILIRPTPDAPWVEIPIARGWEQLLDASLGVGVPGDVRHSADGWLLVSLRMAGDLTSSIVSGAACVVGAHAKCDIATPAGGSRRQFTILRESTGFRLEAHNEKREGAEAVELGCWMPPPCCWSLLDSNVLRAARESPGARHEVNLKTHDGPVGIERQTLFALDARNGESARRLCRGSAVVAYGGVVIAIEPVPPELRYDVTDGPFRLIHPKHPAR